MKPCCVKENMPLLPLIERGYKPKHSKIKLSKVIQSTGHFLYGITLFEFNHNIRRRHKKRNLFGSVEALVYFASMKCVLQIQQHSLLKNIPRPEVNWNRRPVVDWKEGLKQKLKHDSWEALASLWSKEDGNQILSCPQRNGNPPLKESLCKAKLQACRGAWI